MQIHPEPEETEVLPLSQAGTPARVTLTRKGRSVKSRLSQSPRCRTACEVPPAFRSLQLWRQALAVDRADAAAATIGCRRRARSVRADRRISCQLMRPTNALRPLVVNKTGKRNSVLAADSLDRGRVRQMKISDLPMTEHGDSLRSGQDKDLRDGSYLTEMLTERQRARYASRCTHTHLHARNMPRSHHHACVHLAGRPPKQPI